MMYKSNKDINAQSDLALLLSISNYIKYHRLEQNKSQNELAEQAGIDRATLSQIELGRPLNVLTLIQLLRALNKLHVLEVFVVKPQLSPIKLAQMELDNRKRASKNNNLNKGLKSEW